MTHDVPEITFMFVTLRYLQGVQTMKIRRLQDAFYGAAIYLEEIMR